MLVGPSASEDVVADAMLRVISSRNWKRVTSHRACDADPAIAEPHDLDIAVCFSPEAEGDPVATTVELSQLVDHGGVDLLDLQRSGVVARSRALGPPCIPLYERAAGLFALAQMAALAEAMETAPM